MAQPYRDNLISIISKIDMSLPENVELACKHFFSGAALYANGKICGSYTPAGLALKLPAVELEQLFASGAGKKLRYFERSPIKMGYAVLATQVVEDVSQLERLVALSICHVIEKG